MENKEFIIKWLQTNTGLNVQSIYNFAKEIDNLYKKETEKKLTLTDVSQQRELLDAFCCTMEFDIKHETYEEDINYFLENVKADNCG